MALVSGAAALVALVASLHVTRGDHQKFFTAALTAAGHRRGRLIRLLKKT
jgi:hypothetical protein